MDFTSLTIDALKSLSMIAGSYGLGIILLTVIIRMALWPLNVSQQRSMKTMQMLQPKMKMIQERYKNDPQTMQVKMMEFYKEHKFNPMAGCFPLLLQMPVFILLYSALMSPQFIQMAGNSNFLFINRLDATLRGQVGQPYDGSFNVSKHDAFTSPKHIKLYLNGDKTIDEAKFISKDAVKVQGEITPGQNIDFKIRLDDINENFTTLKKVTKADVDLVDRNTREAETITFTRQGDMLLASVPTKAVVSQFNIDVLILVLIFGATMFATQKIMMAANKTTAQDPTQEAMQKTMGTMMPVMLTATFVFIPIPAGVLLYMIVSNIIQVIQTVVINKQLETEEAKKKNSANISSAKKIETKVAQTVEGTVVSEESETTN